MAGQSFGAFTAPLVADRLPTDVLVLVAGMIPSPGDDQPSRASMQVPWPLGAWPDVPTKFVLCTEDRFFPPDFFRRLVAERLDIVPDEIAAGHCVALSRPKELANLLAGCAAEASTGLGTPRIRQHDA